MFKIALCQMATFMDKEENKARAKKLVEEAAANGAQVVVLPEMWNTPYSNDYFRPFAEPQDGPTVKFLSDLAKDNDIYLFVK